MAVDNFIPEFWSARLRRFLDSKLVMAQPRVMNRNWEGEVSQAGDTVHIQRIGGGGTIRDYVRDTAMTAPDRPTDNSLTLTVDQQKAFYIAVDDVNEVQSNVGLMSEFMARTGRNLALVLDGFAASTFVAGATASNILGTDGTPIHIKADGTGDYTPYKFCVEARRLLQKQSTPGEDRWMVINADMEAEFLKDPVFITGGQGAAEALGDGAVRQGQIGRIAGFDILTTEAITASAGSGGTPVANHKLVFGDGNYSLTWADQVIKVEAERLQGQFGDAVKGLNVYGAKIVEPESYGVAHVADPV